MVAYITWERKPERVRIRLLLIQSELETLDRAIRESGALTRTLLILEAGATPAAGDGFFRMATEVMVVLRLVGLQGES
jgi:hypothetical protein